MIKNKFLILKIYISIATLILIIVSYFYFDKSIAFFLQQVPSLLVSCSKFINKLIDPTPNVLLWPLIFYFTRYILKKHRLSETFLLIAISVNFVNLITYFLKMIFGRYRPELLFSKQLYGFNFFVSSDMELSLPSGHAVTISAILLSLSCIYPRHTIFFFITSMILASARLIVEAHYLSDILVSLLLALWISQLIYHYMKPSTR